MSDRTENSRINIYIDNAQAQQALNGLSKEYKKIRGEQKKMAVGSQEWLDKQKELNQVTQKMTEFRKSVDITNMSIKQLRDHSRKLQSIRDNLIPGTEEFKRMGKEIEKVEKQLVKVRGTGGSGLFDSIKKAPAQFMALAGAVYAFGRSFISALSANREFEKSLSELSAITGATGKDLEFLKNKAIEFAKVSTQSSRDIAEAFKLIASAKPELLENGKALAEVTKQAIILAEASGLALPDAATRLTDALNQFNAPAEEAGRYINILAEGSKLGSAEVPQITEALLKFGAVARNANVNIAESTALIETLAEKGLKGAEAGTALRNVLLRMSAPDTLPTDAVNAFEKYGVNVDVLKDKTLPLSVRLKELGKISNDTGAIVEVFGKENAVAAQNVLQNITRVEELTVALSKDGLITALEQAKTATDNLDGDMKRLDNTINSIMVSQGGLSQMFRGLVQNADELIKAFDGIFNSKLRAGKRWDMFFSSGEKMLRLNMEQALVQEKINSLTYEYVATSERRAMLVDALVKAGYKEKEAADIVLEKYFELKKEAKNVSQSKKELTDATQDNTAQNIVNETTLQSLKARLKELNEQLEVAAIGSKKFKDTQKEIANVQAQIDAATNKKSPKQKVETKDKSLKEFYAEIAKLSDDAYENSLDVYKRELLLIDRKYERLYALAVEAGINTNEVQLKHAEELSKKMKEIDERRRKEGILAEEEYQQKMAEAAFRIRLLEIERSGKHELDKRREVLEITIAYTERQMEALQKVQYLTPEQKVQLETLKNELYSLKQELDGIDLKGFEEGFNYTQDIYSKMDAVREAANENQRIREDAELARFIDNEEKKKQALEERLKSGRISQEQYERDIENINKSIDQKRAETMRKQWERDKQMRMSQIRMQMFFEAGKLIIQGIAAQAATAGVPNAQSIAAFAGAALVMAEGGIKLNSIQNEQPPSFGDGGRLPFGAKHSDASGGMYVYDPATGRVVASVEAREGITPSDTVDANEPLFNYMLQNRGKRVTPEVLSTLQPSANYGRAVQNSVLEKSGALNNAVSQKYMPTSERIIQPKEVVVKMVLNDLEDAKNDLEFVKEFNTFK